MENKQLRNPTSANDHCYKCKGVLYEDEETGAMCGHCIWNIIQDRKEKSYSFKDNKKG